MRPCGYKFDSARAISKYQCSRSVRAPRDSRVCRVEPWRWRKCGRGRLPQSL